MPVLSSTQRGALYALAGMGLYSLYDMTIKFLGGNYSSLQVLFCAATFAIPLILAQTAVMGPLGALKPNLPKMIAARSLVAALNGVIGAYAFAHLPLAECYAVFFLMPLMISLLAIPLLGEPVDMPKGLAIVAGLAGVLLVLRPGQLPLSLGHLAAFVSAALGALNYVLLRKTSGLESQGTLMLYPMLAQYAIVAAAMPFVWQPMSASHWGLTALMGVELIAGSIFVIAAYRRAPVIVAAPMQYSQIIWATIFGALFFNEHLDVPKALGIAIIIAAGIFILMRSAPIPPPNRSDHAPPLANRR